MSRLQLQQVLQYPQSALKAPSRRRDAALRPFHLRRVLSADGVVEVSLRFPGRRERHVARAQAGQVLTFRSHAVGRKGRSHA